MGNYIKILQKKMWYVENEAVKIFLYYMREMKKFFSYIISCNPVKGSWQDIVFHLYMISCNPVKGSWQDIVFHLYMISCNPVKGSWQDIVFHLYMISCNPVKGSWQDIVFTHIWHSIIL